MSAVKAVKKDDSDATTGAGDEAAPLPIPNLALAQHYFHLAQPSLTHLHENAAKELLAGIEADEMAPYLATLLETDASLLPPAAKKLLPELEAKNKEALANLDKELTESEESMGETEVSDVLRRKAAYLAQIGDKTRSLAALSLALEKTPGLGARIDINLTILRIGFFFADHALVEEYLPKADALIKEGGDYDRRNRLSLYRARHLLSLRQFSTAAPLLIDALTTFAATELMSWDDLVGLAVLAGVVGLERGDVKAKIIDSPEVRQSFPERPVLEDFAGSLYACDYARFFRSLADVEQTLLLPSRILSAHARYYIREMRIKAYAQLLESYRSLTMDSMCAAFGVGPEFMDNDLSRLISSGRLNCTIDKVNGVVETNRRDRKNAQYEQVIKQGDLLLNSLSKLSKVIV